MSSAIRLITPLTTGMSDMTEAAAEAGHRPHPAARGVV